MEYFADILRRLSEADGDLLLIINGQHSAFADAFFWTMSEKWIWVPLYIALATLLIYRLGMKRGMLALLLAGALIAATDQTCAALIRPVVGRLRPSSPDNPLSAAVTIVNGYRGGNYGFPSCHAANTAALAVFLSLIFRRRYATATLAMWAFTVSYSRIYLGVHYPGDVMTGWGIGIFYALLFYLPLQKANRVPTDASCGTAWAKDRSPS